MNAFIIDGDEITKDVNVTDWTVREGMYIRDDAGQYHAAAFVFPAENKTAVNDVLILLRAKKKEYKDYEAQVYYKTLPRLRGRK